MDRLDFQHPSFLLFLRTPSVIAFLLQISCGEKKKLDFAFPKMVVVISSRVRLPLPIFFQLFEKPTRTLGRLTLLQNSHGGTLRFEGMMVVQIMNVRLALPIIGFQFF